MTSAGYQFKGVLADTLMFATGCGAPVTTPGLTYRRSAIYYDTCGSKGFYVYDPPTFTWNLIGSGDVSFPLFVDTMFMINDSVLRWCKGSLCHDELIKGGNFIADPCIQPWQQTLINGPDLTQDNFSHDHNKIFTYDSLKQMIFHTLDWVKIVADKDAGREYALRIYTNDGGNSQLDFANSTVTNGAYSPLIIGYRAGTGDFGSITTRGIVDSINDAIGSVEPAIQLVAGKTPTSNTNDPNGVGIQDLVNKPLAAIGNATFQATIWLATGQIQLPKYVSGAFAGGAVNGLGVDIDGKVVLTDTVGSGGTTPNLQQVTDVGNTTTDNIYVVGTSGQIQVYDDPDYASARIGIADIFEVTDENPLGRNGYLSFLDVNNKGTYLSHHGRAGGDTTQIIYLPVPEGHTLVQSINGVYANDWGDIDFPPRMTTTERDAIVSPAEGLEIYNTSLHKHQGFDGTTWNSFY